MKKTFAVLVSALAIGLAGIAGSVSVEAQNRGRFAAQPPSPGEVAFKEECGACHMAFPAYFLPARSWVAVMDGLSKHFKENASLDADTAKQIEAYLVANAGDAPGQNARYLRGLDRGNTPLRITDTPYWQREHRRVTPESLARRNLKSASNCQGCHEGAAQGDFGS